jgi:hypothetical protein
MSDTDSFPGLTDLAADLLVQQGNDRLAHRVRPASLYLTGHGGEDGDTIVIEWPPSQQLIAEDDLEALRSALAVVARDAAGWQFGALHQRTH